ncbi:MAG: hypothetical protein Q4D04_03890 [Clostridia bacterium]|nr:hypothetical protein [Clostridia bacterium]
MELYNRAQTCLPSYARLKFDRGEGMFITRLNPEDVPVAVKKLVKNGFLATVKNEMLTVAPSYAIIEEAAAQNLSDVDDHLYKSLSILAGRDICEGERSLFIAACKWPLYSTEAIEKQLRRQAAVCMRNKCGGLLHAIRLIILTRR